MGAEPTYTALAELTLSSTDGVIEFQNIPSNFTYLTLVLNFSASGVADLCMRINSISDATYQFFTMSATGSSQTGTITSNATYFRLGSTSTNLSSVMVHIMDPQPTNKYKGIIFNSSEPGVKVNQGTGTLVTLQPTTTVSLFPASGTFSIGTTAALYGMIS